MFSNFGRPPVGFGPGSQPTETEGEGLDFLPLPSGMRTYEPHFPERARAEDCPQALALLRRLIEACRQAARGEGGAVLDIAALPAKDRALIEEVLGEGEVACKLDGLRPTIAQESVFAGVWRLRGADGDGVAVGAVPGAILARAFEPVRPAEGIPTSLPDGVVNAPALIVELQDQSHRHRPGAAPYLVNLSLLPHTPEDLALFDSALGRGAAAILSRGYGNCRVEATALPAVWRVRFFNSMDVLIQDGFEVSDMPEVVLAAPEDLSDSAGRLSEILEALS